MNRQFSLAGLLRLRRMQQDQAAHGLAQASARRQSVRARQAAALRQLEGSAAPVENSTALRAVAAARSSSQSMLADLETLAMVAEGELQQARAGFTAARTSAVGLEKLETRHFTERLAMDLRAEQGVLDEIASAAWHRDQGAGRA